MSDSDESIDLRAELQRLRAKVDRAREVARAERQRCADAIDRARRALSDSEVVQIEDWAYVACAQVVLGLGDPFDPPP